MKTLGYAALLAFLIVVFQLLATFALGWALNWLY